jgi:hypothetical protein
VFIGGTPIGAPLIGAITHHDGARAGLGVCGAGPVLAVLIRAAVMAAASSRDGSPPVHRARERIGAAS